MNKDTEFDVDKQLDMLVEDIKLGNVTSLSDHIESKETNFREC